MKKIIQKKVIQRLTMIISILAVVLALPVNSFGNDRRCFEGDCQNGHGKFEYQTGIVYHGDWENGKEHGYGIMETTEGIYEGNYENGQPNGKGVFSLPGGGRYSGEWKDGLAEGFGTEIYQDGSSYEGRWHQGLPNGYGTTTIGGAEHQNGYWVDGEYAGSDRPWNID